MCEHTCECFHRAASAKKRCQCSLSVFQPRICNRNSVTESKDCQPTRQMAWIMALGTPALRSLALLHLTLYGRLRERLISCNRLRPVFSSLPFASCFLFFLLLFLPLTPSFSNLISSTPSPAQRRLASVLPPFAHCPSTPLSISDIHPTKAPTSSSSSPDKSFPPPRSLRRGIEQHEHKYGQEQIPL